MKKIFNQISLRSCGWLLASCLICVTLSCDDNETSFAPGNSNNDGGGGGGGTGRGGSMARFAVSGNQLYTVDQSSLNVFDISNPHRPQKVGDAPVGQGIETIFPRGNHLFIGSQAGVFIYSLANPLRPEQLSVFEHVVSCDPVVANDRYAFVTLRSVETVCGRTTNQLDILDIENLSSPQLIKTYPMTHPKGLGLSGNRLFICDAGLKVYDASDVENIVLLEQFDIPANDVIPYQGILLVTAEDGLYQYSYLGNELSLLSKIEIQR